MFKKRIRVTCSYSSLFIEKCLLLRLGLMLASIRYKFNLASRTKSNLKQKLK